MQKENIINSNLFVFIMGLSQKDKMNFRSAHCEPEKVYTVIIFTLSRRL
jgi:hypothetical protein